MNKAEIKAYQESIKPWNKDVEFEAFELLGTDDFNDTFGRFGADLFYIFYDYAELEAVVIINKLLEGEYGK
jgi:hypothetical protein